MNICDSRFEYTPTAATKVEVTWEKKCGFRVRSYDEQKAAAQERMRNVCKSTPRLVLKGVK